MLLPADKLNEERTPATARFQTVPCAAVPKVILPVVAMRFNWERLAGVVQLEIIEMLSAETVNWERPPLVIKEDEARQLVAILAPIVKAFLAESPPATAAAQRVPTTQRTSSRRNAS